MKRMAVKNIVLANEKAKRESRIRVAFVIVFTVFTFLEVLSWSL